MHAIAAEYREGLHHVGHERARPKLIVWLGSNLGNFSRAEAARFLAHVRSAMGEADRMLVGVDLRKDRTQLERAYDDAAGVTARFNLNLLGRINRELGGRFDLDAFEHRATYHEEEGRMELSLVSLRDQEIVIEELDLSVKFGAGEAIHTEDCHKYSMREIEALARDGNLSVARSWQDDAHRFSLSLLAPA